MLLAYLTVSILHFCNLDNYVKRKTYQYQICPYGKNLFHLPSSSRCTNERPVVELSHRKAFEQINGFLTPCIRSWSNLAQHVGLLRRERPPAHHAARALRGTHAGATRNAAHAASAIEQLLSLARGSLRRALPTLPCPSRARRR